MANGRRLQKEREWRQRLARFARADTSIVQFCDDEGVSTPSFFAWRRRLAESSDSAAAFDASPQRQGPFAPVRVTGTTYQSGPVTVWLGGGTRLEIPLTDPHAAALVLGAILQADAERAEGAGGRPC
jgi:hypothetical protein